MATETQRIEFLKKILPYAKQIEKNFGLSHKIILAQAAGECGWKEPKGNMYFGIKDTDGINGNEQLIRTKEIFDNPYKKFPAIHSITPFVKGGKTYYLYDVEDYFRKYDTPYESFVDHIKFFQENKRYSTAWEIREDPYKFATEIAKAGYATALDYEDFLHSMIRSVEKRLKNIEII